MWVLRAARKKALASASRVGLQRGGGKKKKWVLLSRLRNPKTHLQNRFNGFGFKENVDMKGREDRGDEPIREWQNNVVFFFFKDFAEQRHTFDHAWSCSSCWSRKITSALKRPVRHVHIFIFIWTFFFFFFLKQVSSFKTWSGKTAWFFYVPDLVSTLLSD